MLSALSKPDRSEMLIFSIGRSGSGTKNRQKNRTAHFPKKVALGALRCLRWKKNNEGAALSTRQRMLSALSKPDRSEMLIFSIGRSGSGTENRQKNRTAHFQKKSP